MIGVILAVAFETTELVAVSIVFVGEATINVTTPLTGVLWRDFLDSNSALDGLVLGVLLNMTERPLLEIYVIAGEKAPLLRAGMNRRHLSKTSESAGSGALGTLFDSSDAARSRPCRDNRTVSESPTEARWYPIGIRRVPTQNTQVPPNPPTHARTPEETTGTTVLRIGVTATWHGPHLVGVQTLNSQRSRPLYGSGGGNPPPSGRGGCQ